MTIDKKAIDELFPFHKKNGTPSYRKNQKEAVIKLLTCLLDQDYNISFLDCSVGFGKSAVLVTVARYLDRIYERNSYYTTPYKILQDQLKHDYPTIPQIKGRGNYTCETNRRVTCEDSACQLKSDKKYKCPNEETCTYNVAKSKCTMSPICCSNTSYLMSLKRTENDNLTFGNRELLIVDEAHSMPEAGINFVSTTVYESDTVKIPDYKDDFPKYVSWIKEKVLPSLNDYRQQLFVNLYNKESKMTFLQKIKRYKWLKQSIRTIKAMVKSYDKTKEDWVYDISLSVTGVKRIIFQPLTSGQYLNKLLWNYGDKKILSSATIDPIHFIQEGGLQYNEFKYKDCVFTAPSEFDPKKGPIYYKPMGKLTMDNKAVTFPKIINEMNNVIKYRLDRKGIIHSFSYDNARYIYDNIDPKIRPYLVMQDRDDREGSLERWLKSKTPSCFVSTHMTEGLDLVGDLSRYQIYVKIGFPNIKNKRVAKRLELGHWNWFYNLPIMDLEQASGRDIRSVDDWSELFIYDSSFETILQKYNTKLKPWFKSRIMRITKGE